MDIALRVKIHYLDHYFQRRFLFPYMLQLGQGSKDRQGSPLGDQIGLSACEKIGMPPGSHKTGCLSWPLTPDHKLNIEAQLEADQLSPGLAIATGEI